MYMYYSSLNGMYVHVYVHGQSIVVIKQGTGVHICTLHGKRCTHFMYKLIIYSLYMYMYKCIHAWYTYTCT
jgi:hypothetical protein